jgi:hypothetical protein
VAAVERRKGDKEKERKRRKMNAYHMRESIINYFLNFLKRIYYKL